MRNCIFLLLLFVSAAGNAQVRIYEIRAMGIDAGTMEASRREAAGSVYYKLESHTSVNFLLGKTSVDHVTRSTYRDGMLVDSYIRQDKDGKVEYYSTLSSAGSGYTHTSDKGKKTIDVAADFSFVQLYWTEPSGRNRIFSERWGEYISLEKLGDHKYRTVMPNGDKYEYTYENGVLIRADFPSPVGKAHFTLRK